MRAKEVLLAALEKFSGTVVFVSHDRYFIDHLATRVFEVEDGAVQVFPGNYEDYLWRKQGGGSQPPEPEPEPEPKKAADSPPAAKQTAPATQPKKTQPCRLNPIKLRQMKDRRRAIEDEVTRLEVEIADFEAALGNFRSAEETIRLTELLTARRTDLDNLMAEWEQVAELIEANQ
jgi:ATP-binding cassette subfamily F protein 3